jgi:RHH-type rel operon transcriptional repressor/antitoxin RelB
MKGGIMPSTHTVRLPDDLTARLATLARIMKRTKSYFIREALERTIEDLEDAYLAETAYEKFIKIDRQNARRITRFLHDRVIPDLRSIGKALRSCVKNP